MKEKRKKEERKKDMKDGWEVKVFREKKTGTGMRKIITKITVHWDHKKRKKK